VENVVSACPLCGDSVARRVRAVRDRARSRPGGFHLVHCPACDVRFVDPPLSDEELSAYYPDAFYGQPSFVSARMLALFMALRARVVARAKKRRGRLLDIGAGAGDFLASMKARGFDVVGIEPSSAGRERCRSRGLEVRGSLDEVNGASYDVISLWQVAEHARDVVELLRRARALLAPEGALIVSVPNAASLEAQVFGDRWFHLDVPRHQLHFSEAALQTALDRAGLELESFERFSLEYDAFGLLQSALNCAPIEHNALYQVVKHGRSLKDLDRSSRAIVSASLFALPFASALAGMTEWVLARLALNGTMTAIARAARVPDGLCPTRGP
jgi:SAM-dependent methyltransferase